MKKNRVVQRSNDKSKLHKGKKKKNYCYGNWDQKTKDKCLWDSMLSTRLVEIYCGENTNHIKKIVRLLSHTHVVPLLRTHSVPPTHDLPLKLPHVSKVFLQQLCMKQNWNKWVLRASGWFLSFVFTLFIFKVEVCVCCFVLLNLYLGIVTVTELCWPCFFVFLKAATQLARQVQQERT